jgi:hypothetical protein
MNVTALFFTLVLLLTPARSGVPVELVLYRGQGAVWEERVAGRCLTDASGRCAIQGRAEAWADGFLRGEVRWEGHARPLIWPGGDLQIELSETLAGDARYDWRWGRRRWRSAWPCIAASGASGGGLDEAADRLAGLVNPGVGADPDPAGAGRCAGR